MPDQMNKTFPGLIISQSTPAMLAARVDELTAERYALREAILDLYKSAPECDNQAVDALVQDWRELTAKVDALTAERDALTVECRKSGLDYAKMQTAWAEDETRIDALTAERDAARKVIRFVWPVIGWRRENFSKDDLQAVDATLAAGKD